MKFTDGAFTGQVLPCPGHTDTCWVEGVTAGREKTLVAFLCLRPFPEQQTDLILKKMILNSNGI